MAFDAHKNFAISTVAAAPSPASSGTSLDVASGDVANFPAVSFNAVVWPAGANPTPLNAEVIRVTARSTDTFSTIVRAQESSSARTILVGDQIAAAITAKALTDIEGNVDSVAPVTQAFGDAAASGSSAIFARRDHKHGMPSIPIGSSMLVYRYTVTGSDKASIDTGVDTADAGSNDWTDGDLLEFLILARTDEAVTRSSIGLTFNNDGAGNYDLEELRALGTSVAAAGTPAGTSIILETPGANATASYATAIRGSVVAFSHTDFYKTIELTSGYNHATAGSNFVSAWVFTWRNTAAITRAAIAPITAAKKLKVGSQLLIYKRKAS